MSKTITVKNLNNKTMTIPYEGDMFDVEQLKKEIAKCTNENYEQFDYKVIYNGSVLENDHNLATEEYVGKTIVYMKTPKKVPKIT